MDPAVSKEASVPANGTARSAKALVSLAEELDSIVERMDTLGLSLAANHVSQGIDLIRSEALSLQSGDS